MNRVIIIRYSEIYLKGKNRGFFEKAFEKNLTAALKGIDCQLIRQSGRYLVENFAEYDTDEIVERLKKVFGLHTLSVAYETESDMQSIFDTAKLVCRETGTFKVESHRGNKKYPLTSVEISRQLGGMLLSAFHGLKVDVHNPDFTVRVDIRESGKALIFSEFIEGANGMPVGTAGKGLLLLS
ncbi:MAG: tRNA 4-thiouridine(8) synthase ThiI, partial [Clostridia bacterium]|nr:tRNA 4-thiouridine(8) synthase ThiI [Clostridia bacterium]